MILVFIALILGVIVGSVVAIHHFGKSAPTTYYGKKRYDPVTLERVAPKKEGIK